MHEMDFVQLPEAASFRPMTVDDIPAICEIEQESFLTPWTAAAFYNELKNNYLAKYIVLEMDGETAGYGGMWIILEEAHITNVAIRTKYRGQKLGEALMRQLLSLAVVLGAGKMTLEVRVSNSIAQNLYRKLGFYSAGVRPGYYTDNNEDALIMWADLPRLDAAHPEVK